MSATRRAARRRRRSWIFKSEPSVYSFADLVRDGRTLWEGVRNHQARNFLRDEVAVGDEVFFYHSSVSPPVIAGLARVVEAAYPDPTQFDPASPYHDPRALPGAPIWYAVDIAPVAAVAPPVRRDELKGLAALADSLLLKRGCRLSILPLTAAEGRVITRLVRPRLVGLGGRARPRPGPGM